MQLNVTGLRSLMKTTLLLLKDLEQLQNTKIFILNKTAIISHIFNSETQKSLKRDLLPCGKLQCFFFHKIVSKSCLSKQVYLNVYVVFLKFTKIRAAHFLSDLGRTGFSHCQVFKPRMVTGVL